MAILWDVFWEMDLAELWPASWCPGTERLVEMSPRNKVDIRNFVKDAVLESS